MNRQLRARCCLAVTAGGLLLGMCSHAAAETVAITGGKVYPVSAPAIENGTVVIVDGKITAVGANVSIPSGARRIDARGKWVTPGLIHSSTALGVVEVDAVKSGNDDSAKGEHGIAAAFHVWDALNPDSELWTPARQDGVTAVVVAPSGGFVAGQAALVETLRGPVGGMVRKAPVGMVVDLTNLDAAEATARGEVLLRLRDLLDDAAAFGKGQSAYESNQLRELGCEEIGPRRAAACTGGFPAVDRPCGARRGHPGASCARSRTIAPCHRAGRRRSLEGRKRSCRSKSAGVDRRSE